MNIELKTDSHKKLAQIYLNNMSLQEAIKIYEELHKQLGNNF